MIGGAVSTYGLSFPPGPERIDQQPPAVAGEEELGQVNVPGALRRPADELAGPHSIAFLHARVDVAVAEVADADVPAYALRGRLLDDAALDREDAVCPAGGRAGLGLVVPDRDVDASVVDRAQIRVGPRVEKRAADGMLLMLGRRRASRGSRRCSAAGRVVASGGMVGLWTGTC